MPPAGYFLPPDPQTPSEARWLHSTRCCGDFLHGSSNHTGGSGSRAPFALFTCLYSVAISVPGTVNILEVFVKFCRVEVTVRYIGSQRNYSWHGENRKLFSEEVTHQLDLKGWINMFQSNKKGRRQADAKHKVMEQLGRCGEAQVPWQGWNGARKGKWWGLWLERPVGQGGRGPDVQRVGLRAMRESRYPLHPQQKAFPRVARPSSMVSCLYPACGPLLLTLCPRRGDNSVKRLSSTTHWRPIFSSSSRCRVFPEMGHKSLRILNLRAPLGFLEEFSTSHRHRQRMRTRGHSGI